MEATIYKCSECGEEVTVEDGVVKRTCEHEESVVIADLEAIAYGKSSLD